MLEGEPEALDRLVDQGALSLDDRNASASRRAERTSAWRRPSSASAPSLIGHTAKTLSLFHRTGLTLLAVSRRDKRFTERLGEITIKAGDVIVLQGDVERLPELLREWDCLPLAERKLQLGSVRRGLVPAANPRRCDGVNGDRACSGRGRLLRAPRC